MRIGLDIGSTTLKCVVLDDNDQIVYKDYQRHFSQITSKTVGMLQDIIAQFPEEKEMSLCISGSAGMGIADSLGIAFEQEVYATRVAVNKMIPGTDVVIELGGEDAKILFLTDGLEVRMNGSCAGGTGAFIDQMATLLNMEAGAMNEVAKNYEKIYTLASRCGVFAKSDVQPLLNQGAQKNDIAASIFYAVVNQTIAGLAQGREIEGKVVYLGGPLTFLSELRKAFDTTLKLEGIAPDNSLYYVALGAALRKDSKKFQLQIVVLGGDDARHMGTVAVVVVTVAGACDDVDAVVVVDVAVLVIVDAVVGDLVFVAPDVLGQILVVKVHAGIDDSDDDAGAAAGGGELLHAVIDAAGVQVPLILDAAVAQQILGDHGVVADVGGVDGVVVVHQQDAVDGTQSLHGGGGIGAGDQTGLIPGSVLQLEQQLQLCNTGLSHGIGDGAVHGAGELDQQRLLVVGHLLLLHQLGVELVKGDVHGALLVVALGLGVHGGLGGFGELLRVGGGSGFLLLAELILDQVGQLLVGQLLKFGIGAGDELRHLLQAVPVGLHSGKEIQPDLLLFGGDDGRFGGFGGGGGRDLHRFLKLGSSLGALLGSGAGSAAAADQRQHHHGSHHQGG